MEPRLSKRKAKKASLLLGMVLAILVFGLVIASAVVMIAGLLAAFAVALYTDDVCKCPHCGMHFRGVHIGQMDEGYCRKCGKLMKYDE